MRPPATVRGNFTQTFTSNFSSCAVSGIPPDPNLLRAILEIGGRRRPRTNMIMSLVDGLAYFYDGPTRGGPDVVPRHGLCLPAPELHNLVWSTYGRSRQRLAERLASAAQSRSSRPHTRPSFFCRRSSLEQALRGCMHLIEEAENQPLD